MLAAAQRHITIQVFKHVRAAGEGGSGLQPSLVPLAERENQVLRNRNRMAAEAPAQAADETYSDDDDAFIDDKESSGFHVVADLSGNEDGAPPRHLRLLASSGTGPKAAVPTVFCIGNASTFVLPACSSCRRQRLGRGG